MERRVGACLEDEVAFGVENESAHIGHYGAAAGQEHPEGQADLGIGALDQVDEYLAALDLPEGDPVGRERPLNVAVDLKADGVAGGVEQDLEGLVAADVDLDREAAGGGGALVDEAVLVRIRPVSGGVASAAVGASTARAAAMPMTMSVRIGRPGAVWTSDLPITEPSIVVVPG